MRRLLSAAALLLLAACSGEMTSSATTGVAVQLDRAEYDRGATGEAPVRFTVTNHTSGTVSLQWCGGVGAEMQLLSDGRWLTTLAASCLAVYEPVTLAPGQSADGTVFAPGPAGTYRLRVTYGAPGPAMAREALSPSFQLR
jgi:hypothetical protein